MCLTFILIVVFHSTVAFVNNANRINIGHNMMINNKNNSSFGVPDVKAKMREYIKEVNND